VASIVLPRNSLIMVGGVPGSGKSHLLERVRTHEFTCKISADEIRGAIQARHGFDPEGYFPQFIEEARQEFFEELHHAWSAAESILVEAAYLSKHSRQEMIQWCDERNYTPHLLLVQATWEQCLAGVRARTRGVPEEKLRNYWRDYLSLEASLQAGKVDTGLASVLLVNRDDSIEEIVFGA
jgi:predicted kinase